MNLNPEYFGNVTLAELLKTLRAGRTFRNDMGLILSINKNEQKIEVATQFGDGVKAIHGWFSMTQQGLEDAILVGFQEIEEESESLLGWQVYSHGETYKLMSDEYASLNEALTDLKEAEVEAADQEWSLRPVYVTGSQQADASAQYASA